MVDMGTDRGNRPKIGLRPGRGHVLVVDAWGRGSGRIELRHVERNGVRTYAPLSASGQREYELRPSLDESEAKIASIRIHFTKAVMEKFLENFTRERNHSKHATVQRRGAELTISNERIAEMLQNTNRELIVSSGLRLRSVKTDRRGITHDDQLLDVVGALELSETHPPMMKGMPMHFTGKYRLILKVSVEASSEHPLKLPNDGTAAYHAREVFLITIYPLNCRIPTLKPSGIPWVPRYALKDGDMTDHETIMVCSPEGQEADEDLSRKAAEVDPWTQLPPPHESDRQAAAASGMRIVPITKMGLELEDVESLLERVPVKDKNVLSDKIIGTMLALFSGSKLTEDTNVGAYYQKALQYVKNNAGPAITHSGKVRTVGSEERGENTSYAAILARIVLSRLVTAVIKLDEGVEVPFHLWSKTNLQALKIPICLTNTGLLVYTADSVFNRLLQTHSVSWSGKSSMIYSGSEPRVVGEIFSPLYKVTGDEGSRPKDFTHTLLEMDGTEYSLDGIIHDMGVICMNDGELRTGVGRALIWHPAFCILMSVKDRIPTAIVIAGPRSSRIVRPFKNQSEILLGVDAGQVLMHEATIVTASGYLSALIKHLRNQKTV
jgi:hypothetical protein